MKSKPEEKMMVTGWKYVMLEMVDLKIPLDMQALWYPSKMCVILESAVSKLFCRWDKKKN